MTKKTVPVKGTLQAALQQTIGYSGPLPEGLESGNFKSFKNGLGERCWIRRTPGGTIWGIYDSPDKKNYACFDGSAPMTAAELQAYKKGQAAAQEAKWESAAELAKSYCESLPVVAEGFVSDHDYAIKKELPWEILRESGIKMDTANQLVIPIHGGDYARIVAYQTISSDGVKWNMPGAQFKGSFAYVGGHFPMSEFNLDIERSWDNFGSKDWVNPCLTYGKGLRFAICEGIATAVSVFQILRCPVLAAMCAGNLMAVALKVRHVYGAAEIIIAADNDYLRKGGNLGVEKAIEAAKAIGAKLITPPRPYKDFNDALVGSSI